MIDDDKILNVDDVLSIMPRGITKGWLYDNWEKLGGVKIARRKLILKTVLYDHLQAGGLVLHQGNYQRRAS